MSRKTLTWANKEVETFLCILGEEDVVDDVYVAAAAIDIRPTLKGTVGGGNATSELSWAPFPESIFSLMARFHCRVRNGSVRKGAVGRGRYSPAQFRGRVSTADSTL